MSASIPKTHAELITAAYDPQMIQQAGQQMVDLLAKHLQTVQSGSGPVLQWEEPERNIAQAEARLSEGDANGCGEPAALLARMKVLIEESLSRGQNLHHPRYVGHQVPASLPLAALMDAVGTLTNQVMAIYEMGPWATSVERAVLGQLGEAIGFSAGEFGGLVTSGGSLANLTALLTARNIALGDVWTQGLVGRKPAPVIVAHADSHYSVTRSAGILGLGADQVVRVPLDRRRRMDVDQLDGILADLRRRGVPIVAVSAAACATPIGAFDKLDDVSDVCRRHEVWLHVDAAHGGAACLSEKYRHLVAGLEKADSVVCDAHKMMFIPALCAFVFYRQREHRFAAFEQEAPYLFDSDARDRVEYDNGLTTLECTKRAAALGVWGVWSLFGRRLFEALVDTTFDLGSRFYDLLCEQKDFEPFCRPECNIVVFRHLPAELHDAERQVISDFQLRLRQSVVRSGDFYLVPSTLEGDSYLRTTLINPLTTETHLQELLDCLREHGRRLLG